MRLNVLITAASRRVGLVRGFQQALHRPGLSGEVMVCDVNPASPAVHLADRAFEVPLSDDPAYFDAVQAICLRHQIGLVVPTIDDEIPRFAAVRDRFDAIGTRVAVSPLDTALATTDKWETCRRLAAAGVAAATTWLPEDLPAAPRFPLFVKPRSGRGSIQAFAARDAVELEFFLRYVSAPVVQQYLEGPEFTLDLLCDFEGRPLSVVPRERVVIRAGVIDRGRTVQDPKLIALALACAEVFTFAGPVNIQCRTVDGSPTVFEINPRFSGGIPLTIAAGADFPATLVDLALGRPVAPAIGAFRGDLWMSSFEASLFLEPAQLALERCVHDEAGKGKPS
jgi:carbamoyl-phosphate synthase large subunit